MKITVLVDNLPYGNFASEWGLSFYIEHNNHKLLLDAGASSMFAENAKKLDIDLSLVEMAFLSHSHFDHADGLPTFFHINTHAPLFLHEDCTEDCYSQEEPGGPLVPDGIPKNFISTYKNRLHFTKNVVTIYPGLTIVPHSNPSDLQYLGEKNRQYRKINGSIVFDDFAHEQSLVFETPRGLVVFNSCSHGGMDVILDEVRAVFPGKKILAYLGGLHLFLWSDEEVSNLANVLKQLDVEKIVTGHCTGERAFSILRQTLGGSMIQLHSGLSLDIE